MMAVWLFANCCLLSRYHLIPAQAPASLERACNLCRPDWLGQGMPGVDDTNYKTKASFHPSFRLLWPGRANTSLRKHEGELEFTRFNIFADTEWWVMERYSNVICDTRRGLSVPRLWSLTDHRGQVMSSLRSHHRRYYANMWRSFKKLSSSADIHECWHLRTDDEAVIVTATWSDIVQSQFQLLRIPQHLLINFTFMSGPDVEKWPDARSGNEEWEEVRWGVGPPRRDAESNDPEVRLVRT